MIKDQNKFKKLDMIDNDDDIQFQLTIFGNQRQSHADNNNNINNKEKQILKSNSKEDQNQTQQSTRLPRIFKSTTHFKVSELEAKIRSEISNKMVGNRRGDTSTILGIGIETNDGSNQFQHPKGHGSALNKQGLCKLISKSHKDLKPHNILADDNLNLIQKEGSLNSSQQEGSLLLIKQQQNYNVKQQRQPVMNMREDAKKQIPCNNTSKIHQIMQDLQKNRQQSKQNLFEELCVGKKAQAQVQIQNSNKEYKFKSKTDKVEKQADNVNDNSFMNCSVSTLKDDEEQNKFDNEIDLNHGYASFIQKVPKENIETALNKQSQSISNVKSLLGKNITNSNTKSRLINISHTTRIAGRGSMSAILEQPEEDKLKEKQKMQIIQSILLDRKGPIDFVRSQGSPLKMYGYRNYQNEEQFASVSQRSLMKNSDLLFNMEAKYTDHHDFKQVMKLKFKKIFLNGLKSVVDVVQDKKAQLQKFEDSNNSNNKTSFMLENIRQIMSRRLQPQDSKQSKPQQQKLNFNFKHKYQGESVLHIQSNLNLLNERIKQKTQSLRLQAHSHREQAINQLRIWNIAKRKPNSELQIGIRQLQLQLSQGAPTHNQDIYCKLIESYRSMVQMSREEQVTKKLLERKKEKEPTCTNVYLKVFKENFPMFKKNQLLANRILLFFNINPIEEYEEITFEQYCDFVGTLIFRELGLDAYKIFFVQQIMTLEQQYKESLTDAHSPKEEFLCMLSILTDRNQERYQMYLQSFLEHGVLLDNENSTVDLDKLNHIFASNKLNLDAFLNMFL